MKIFQFQTTGDEFFILDNEVGSTAWHTDLLLFGALQDAFWQDLQRATGGTYLR